MKSKSLLSALTLTFAFAAQAQAGVYKTMSANCEAASGTQLHVSITEVDQYGREATAESAAVLTVFPSNSEMSCNAISMNLTQEELDLAKEGQLVKLFNGSCANGTKSMNMGIAIKDGHIQFSIGKGAETMNCKYKSKLERIADSLRWNIGS